MPKPKSPRGRKSPKLVVRCSFDELYWVQEAAAGKETSVAKVVRDRVFAGMPGYKP